MPLYNELFSRSFCINLEKRKDRWEHVSEEFRRMSITVERVEGVDGSIVEGCPGVLGKGEYGCLLGHINALEAGVSSGADTFVIYEDDVIFNPMFHFLFERWYREIPGDWRVINFGVRNKMTPLVVGKHTRQLYRFWNAHAYAIKSAWAPELIRLLKEEQGSVDSVLSTFSATGGVYGFSEMLVWQGPGFSDHIGEESAGHDLNKIKNQW